jgi:hypothetical protein
MEYMYKLSDNIERKFIEINPSSDWEIESEEGFVDIISSNKTIEYALYKITLENSLFIECADTHILIDKDYNEIFAIDSLDVEIRTKMGISKVILVENQNCTENMYDLSIDSENHTYYTNNILSHNTQTVAAYILYYSIFNDNKTVAVLANKASAAREILSRYQLMFEYLPNWLQQGVKVWNKGDIELENNSKVFTAATSASGIRGKSCVSGDTEICIRDDTNVYKININQLIYKPSMQVLTQKGFKNFKSILDQGHQETITIKFLDIAEITCTLNHRFLQNDVWIEAKTLSIGDVLQRSVIIDIANSGIRQVYDLQDVQETNSYYTNGIISHNCNLLYVDEAAIIPNNIAEEFFTSTYPTISSGKTTKVVLTSTPLGYNLFWKYWNEAENGINGFVPVSVNYWEHPGRDEVWANEQKQVLGELKFNQEILCVGGDTTITLMDSSKQIIIIPISEAYKYLDYKILTPSGFQEFDGIIQNKKDTLKISFYDNTFIITTPDHIFIDGLNKIKSKDLIIGQYISNKKILDITPNGVFDVYDPINVANGNLYISDGLISHNCSFLGSSSTLIHSDTLSRLTATPFIYSKDGLDVSIKPISNHNYVMVVDTAKGVGGDYSAFTIIDITTSPYILVAKYKCNRISPLLYPNMIYKVATEYNNAYVLIEINSSEQVSYILYSELEYENILFITRNNKGQSVSSGFSNTKSNLGVTTDRKIKRIGCTNLKTLLEENKLLINDIDTIKELSTFIETNGYYAADEGYHDDLTMTLVLFAWLTADPYFKLLTNINMRDIMFEDRMRSIEQEMLPVGWLLDGSSDDDNYNF